MIKDMLMDDEELLWEGEPARLLQASGNDGCVSLFAFIYATALGALEFFS